MRKHFYIYLIAISLLPLLISGCTTTRFLKDGQYVLNRHQVKGNSAIKEEELLKWTKAKPNSRTLFLPVNYYVSMYQHGLGRYDSAKYQQELLAVEAKYDRKLKQYPVDSRKYNKLLEKKRSKVEKKETKLKEGNFWMRNGEPLAIFDSAKVEASAASMEALYRARGYFSSTVNYEVGYFEKLARVTYRVKESNPHLMDTASLTTTDEDIYHILLADLPNSLLKKGMVYSQNTLSKERDRIDALMKDEGYYEFSKEYVSFKVDTLNHPGFFSVETIISNPTDENVHQLFTLDSVTFTTDASVSGLEKARTEQEVSGIVFSSEDHKMSEKVLSRRVFIRPGEPYSKTKTLQTQRQLANLDMFRFVNVNYDTTGGKMVAHIFTSPLEKYQTSYEAGLNVTQGIPGPIFNLGVKNRNTFRGLEILELSGGYAMEGVQTLNSEGISRIDVSQQWRANLSLTFPQFLFPLSEKKRLELGQLNPKTKLTLGYGTIDRPDYFKSNVNTTFDYIWRSKKGHQYIFTPFEGAYINSRLSEQFRKDLEELARQGNNLINSYLPSVVTAMSFRGIFNFNRDLQNPDRGAYLQVFAESGGAIIGDLLQSVYERNNLQSYRYFKYSFDFRKYVTLNDSKTARFAYRLNYGMAIAYGKNKQLPSERYFFAGGSSSNRGWVPRRLGPGYFVAPAGTNYDQPGEMIIETNFEYRQKLFGFFEGALFVDVGNVWTLGFNQGGESGIEDGPPVDGTELPPENDRNIAGKFEFESFLGQLGVTVGAGLRLDFDFMLIRFDVGVRAFDPARPDGKYFVLPDLRWSDFRLAVNPASQVLLNIGIGYPF
ncbi:BamA/TamA family outer membrane protein [Persicobacter sp. CCB-QB2]|uniref:translocation and assembly module lipoprotein TamL n=1 Tax=Persicobacter sp. CCB-QB2 TaxID=1561025 RepID=UPI0012F90889|nr:BamA/TamA family outer membrane protein [Persicobacter sp. CCB-QB2]